MGLQCANDDSASWLRDFVVMSSWCRGDDRVPTPCASFLFQMSGYCDDQRPMTNDYAGDQVYVHVASGLRGKPGFFFWIFLKRIF